jgi:hypothetical protein
VVVLRVGRIWLLLDTGANSEIPFIGIAGLSVFDFIQMMVH